MFFSSMTRMTGGPVCLWCRQKKQRTNSSSAPSFRQSSSPCASSSMFCPGRTEKVRNMVSVLWKFTLDHSKVLLMKCMGVIKWITFNCVNLLNNISASDNQKWWHCKEAWWAECEGFLQIILFKLTLHMWQILIKYIMHTFLTCLIWTLIQNMCI